MKDFKTTIEGRNYEVKYSSELIDDYREFHVIINDGTKFDFKVSVEAPVVESVIVEHKDNTQIKLDIANKVYENYKDY